jgi:hypothetical protein
MNIRFKGLLIAMLCVVISLSVVNISSAHHYSGRRWAGNTVTYYIGGGGFSMPIAWIPEIQAAAEQWTYISISSFSIIEVSPVSAAANFGSKYFSSDSDPNNNSWHGEAYSLGNPTIWAASAYINRDYTWYTSGGNLPDVRSLALHEMGHWINYNDIYGSTCPSSTLMCWVSSSIRRSFSNADRDELAAAYP